MAGDNEPVQSARLEIGASKEQLEKGLDAAASVVHKFTQENNRQFAQMSARIQGYVDKIDAREAAVRMGLLEQAVAKLGGTSNLTAPQLTRVQEELRKLADQGGRVPTSLQAIGKEADKLTAAAKAAAGGQGWSGVLGAIAPQAAAAAAGVAGLVAAAGVAGDKIGKAVLQTAAYAANIRNLSESYNMNAHALQRLGAAAADSDVPLQTVLSASKNIAKELIETPDKFRQLGLSVEQLLAMSPDEQFFAVAEALRDIKNETQQTAAAQDLLGKGGSEILRMLKSDMRGAADEAERMGRIMGTDQLRAAAELKDELDKLDKTLQGLTRNAASLITGNENLALSIRTLREAIGDLSRYTQEHQDDLRDFFTGGAAAATTALPAVRLFLMVVRQANDQFDKLRGRQAAKDIELPAGEKRPLRATVETSESVDQLKTHNAIAKIEEAAGKRRLEIAARNRELDGKASAEAMERERKRAEELSHQLLTIKTRELAIRKGITEDAARSEIEAERKGSEWLQKRTKNDADVVARAEAVKADAKRLGMSAIDAQIDKIEEATEAAIRHVAALELEGKIGVAAAEDARDAYNEAAEAEIRYAEQAEAIDKIGKVRDLFGELVGLLEDLGVEADSGLGKAASAGLQYLEVVQHNAKAAAAAMSGDFVTATIESVKSIRGYIGIVKTLFSEPSWKKVGREAGRVLGTEISEELAKQIEKTSKDLKISVGAASLLNLSKAIEESRRDAREFGAQIGQLMAGITDGSIPAKEGVAELGSVFNEVREAAAAAGTVGDAALTSILKAARELGGAAYTEEMKAFTGDKLDASAGFLNQWIEAFAKLKGLGSEAMATLGAQGAGMFMANFQAVAAERGKLAAVAMFGDGFEKLKEQLAAGGNEAALALLEPFQRWQNYVTDETLGPLLQMSEAARGQMVNLADAGYLNVDAFATMQQSGAVLFDSLIEKGMALPDALEALAPTIQAAISAAEQFGVPLDADMERLRGIAEQNGYTFQTGPMQQMVDILKLVAVQLGVLPEALEKSATSAEAFGARANQVFGEAAAGAETMAQDVVASWDAGTGEIALLTEEMGGDVGQEIADMGDAAETVFGYMTKDLESSLSRWAEIADSAKDDVLEAIAELPDSVHIPISFDAPSPGAFGFNYDGSPDNDDDKSNSFEFGGIEDFGKESIIAVHGREAIVPEGGSWFMDMLRQAVREGGAGGGSTIGGGIAVHGDIHVHGVQDPEAFARAVRDAYMDNKAGLKSVIRG